MATELLHILNGDATKYLFNETSISGEVVVMRELFSQGKVVANDHPEFWNIRKAYFQNFYFVSEEEYEQKILNELKRALAKSNEIVIWYEYDLYCQLNTLFLAQWLISWNKTNISIICSGKKDDTWIGLGERPSLDYPELLENRQSLSEIQIESAKKIWKAFTNEDARQLMNIIPECESWPYMKRAMKGHIKRFPDTRHGLGILEMKILKFIGDQSRSGKAIIKKLLDSDELFGFGDLQYLNVLRGLSDLLISRVEFESKKSISDLIDAIWKSDFSLNQYGKNVLRGIAFRKPSNETYLGGALKSKFVRNGQNIIHK